ncbi:MAG: MMPL family transporter [bacterium]|nr:MMPL family transporter [bacterium]
MQFLKFDYDFEAFFPNEDRELELYSNYRKTFEYDNEFVLLALENKAGIFRKDFLLQVDSLTKELQKLEFVKHVSSATNMKTTSLGGLVPFQSRLLRIENEEYYAADSAAIYDSPFLIGSYFPQNAKSLSLFIKTKDGLSKKQSDQLSNEIRAGIAAYSFDEFHLAGRIFAQQVYLENIQKEFVWFLAIAFVFVVIFLWFSFRSVFGVVVPVTVVLVSILYTLGIMNLFGKSIDIMSIMLPTMIFVAGVSDVVHFFSKYFEELEKGTAREKIYRVIVKEVAFPTFLTLITTVVGFLSLLFSSIRPVREFGIYTSLGITIAFILTYTLLPAILYFYAPHRMISKNHSHTRVNKIMSGGFFWILKHQKLIFGISMVLLVLSLVGITKIKVNNILLEDLSDKVRVKQDFKFFDENYSGARPFELLVTLKDSQHSVWDYNTMRDLYMVNEFVKYEYSAGFILSAPSIVAEIYRTTNFQVGGRFPPKAEYEAISTLLISNKNSKEIKRVVRVDGLSTRISAKVKDMGSAKINEHNKQLMQFIAHHTDTNLLSFKITGAAQLMDRNNEYMVSNMANGFLFSIFVIGLLTFFLHRSWRMMVVFLLPNLIPLLVVAGVMGFAGIELKAATSLIFSIAFGIATDDTIHFISRLKLELGYGKSLLYAFKRTYFETGKPIILTTFILVGGFVSLMTSNFESTFYFGFLICITIVVAVLADIFLLPVLLFLVYRKKEYNRMKKLFGH